MDNDRRRQILSWIRAIGWLFLSAATGIALVALVILDPRDGRTLFRIFSLVLSWPAIALILVAVILIRFQGEIASRIAHGTLSIKAPGGWEASVGPFPVAPPQGTVNEASGETDNAPRPAPPSEVTRRRNSFGFDTSDANTNKATVTTPPAAEVETSASSTTLVTSVAHLREFRDQKYLQNHGYFLLHKLSPSKYAGQRYDVTIFVVKHQRGGTPRTELPQVTKVEFYLGKSWGDRIFEVLADSEHRFGLQTAAYGSFLCVARVTLGETPILLDRYVDFTMGP